VIETVYEDEAVLVVNKPSAIPTVPVSKTDEKETLLTLVARTRPEVLSVKSRNPWEGGVLHRLDTLTSGLVLMAKTQFAYDRLMVEQYNGRIVKTYFAKVHRETVRKEGFEGFPYGDAASCPLVINSYFRPYGPRGAEVRPVTLVTSNQMKKVGKHVLYTTETAPEGENLLACTLTKGFRHQVRCHLAWAGYPIDGDEVYGGKESDEFGLSAVSITFLNPTDKKVLTITL
jgi:Pseudouridylate synthases, 23S RNA-specific